MQIEQLNTYKIGLYVKRRVNSHTLKQSLKINLQGRGGESFASSKQLLKNRSLVITGETAGTEIDNFMAHTIFYMIITSAIVNVHRIE